MSLTRVIPRLDIKGESLVKGVHLEGLRVLGRPEEFSQYYYCQGADEIIYHDAVASLYQRNSLLDVINKTAQSVFIPLTVGGGIRSLEDIAQVLRAGADKVSINTAAVQTPEFITEAAKVYGSSTIVVAIEVSKQGADYLCFTDNGREQTAKKLVDWVPEIESRGAGEILLTSIDREGTGTGYDCDLVELVTAAAKIPVIIHGGAGGEQHFVEVIRRGQPAAVSAASIFHYGAIQTWQNEDNTKELFGNTEFLRKSGSWKQFGEGSIMSVKKELSDNGIQVREL